MATQKKLARQKRAADRLAARTASVVPQPVVVTPAHVGEVAQVVETRAATARREANAAAIRRAAGHVSKTDDKSSRLVYSV